MQVKVNCKKKPIDFSTGDFRSTIRSRYAAKKTVDAELTIADDGTMSVDTGSQVLEFSPGNTRSLAFFVDGDRTYIEAVTGNGNKETSFLIAPAEDNLSLWQDGVVNLRMAMEPLASSAGIEVNEIIDPNPIGLCPDGIDDMDSLIEERLIEGADILYMGQDDAPASDFLADEPYYDGSLDPSAPFELGEQGAYESEDSLADWGDVLDEIDENLEDGDIMGGERFSLPDEQPSDDQYDFLYDPEAYAEPAPLPDDGYYGDATGGDAALDGYDELSLDYEELFDEDIPAAGDEWAPATEDISIPGIPEGVEEIKTNAADAMDEAYGALTGLRASLEEERARRVNEMHRLAAELAGTDFIPASEPVVAPAAPEPVVIESEQPAEVAEALRSELDNLSITAEDIDLELNDYDRIITESKRQQQELVESLDNGGDRDAVVAGLINMYQEQTECTEQINTLLKKEQVLKNLAVDQRDEAYQTIEEQKSELDKLRRSLKFSEKSKRRSEQFVKDAKREIRTTVQKARSKVEEAIAACERMQEQVNRAEERATNADERRSEAELARLEAYRVRDEALQELAEEKRNSQALLEACDRQLNEFIEESVNKIQVQIERANTAEQSASIATSRISELESELAETKTRLLGYESKCSKKEVDIKQLRKQRDEAESRVSDMTVQYQSADTQRKETGRILSETESELVRTRATVKKLSETLVATKEARDAAIAEKVSAIQQVTEQCSQQLMALASEKDGDIANLVGAKEDALAANQQFIAAMSTALSLPDGFGARKKKLDAITDAYNSFVLSTQSAEERGSVPAQAGTYQGEVSDMVVGFGMKPMPQPSEPVPYGDPETPAVEPTTMLGDEFVGLYVPEAAIPSAHPQQ